MLGPLELTDRFGGPAQRAQHRLHQRFWRIEASHNKNVAAVAVARELAGFVWGLMTERTT